MSTGANQPSSSRVQTIVAGISKRWENSDATAISIVGATGVGKSEIADRLAFQIDGEVVSADSMQIYRGMNIGTAKMPIEKRSVAYHCIDIVDPGEAYSASVYQVDARGAIGSIVAKGKVPILCGGTGLYVRAALDDMRFPKGEQVDNPIREKYSAIYEQHGAEYLHGLLADVDLESANLIHPNNVRRVIRAFEMLEEGVSYARQNEGMKEFSPFIECEYFGLEMDRELLYEKINSRVDKMIDDGLVDEVAALVGLGFEDAITSIQAIGYKEIVDAMRGRCTIEDAIEQIKQSTRRYSKRQGTWFRRDPRIHWIDALSGEFL